MSTPKLSIIVPIYKVEAYLEQCLESLTQQTLSNIEIILVDDESPDRCPQICDEYAQQDARIKVIHKKNEGLGLARNSGMAIATGEYMTFIDSDDYIDIDAYKKLCLQMDSMELDEIRFTNNRFKDNGDNSPLSYSDELTVIDQYEDIRELALCIFSCPKELKTLDWGGSSCMAIYRSSIIKQNNLKFESEREYLSEDWLFNFHYYLCCNKVAYIPSTYYHYRINPTSITQNFDLQVIRKVEKYASYIEAEIEKYHYGQECKQFAMGYYVGTSRTYITRLFLTPVQRGQKKDWFLDQTKTMYYKHVMQNFDDHKLEWKQRLFYFFFKSKKFWLSYLSTIIFSALRNNQLK